MTAPHPLAILKRLLHARPNRDPGSACQRCGAALPADHLHLADIDARTLDCVCAACHSAVPARSSEARAPLPVPRRYVRVPGDTITAEEWDALEIPVGIAFFFHNSALGRSVVSYPSPAGATESLLAPETWERVVRSNPRMPAITPDLEALLVRRTHAASDCYLVPIDACYELAGRIRRRWRGFGGGPEVPEEIDSFFTMLGERSETP